MPASRPPAPSPHESVPSGNPAPLPGSAGPSDPFAPRAASLLLDAFDQMPAFVAVQSGPDLVFDYANAACRQLVGHRDLIGRSVREAFPEIEGQGFIELLESVLATGEPYRGDEVPVRLQRTPGGPLDERYVDLVYQPLLGPDGTPHGVLTQGVDVTERVEARRALEAARLTTDLLLAHSPDVLCALDADGRIVHVSPAVQAVFGHAPETMEGRPYTDFLHPDDRPANAGRRFRAGTPVYTAHNRFVHRDGSTVYMEWSAAWPEDSPVLLAVGRDVTGARAREEALRESQARLHALVDQVAVGIAQTDLDGRFTSVNARFCEITGRPSEALLGTRMQDLTHADDLAHNLDLLAAALRDGTPFLVEKRYLRPDGAVVWVRNHVTAIRDASGAAQSLVAICLDVTAERAAIAAERAAAEALREGTGMLRTLLANLPDTVVYQAVRELNGQTRFTYMSEGVERLHGVTAEEAVRDPLVIYRQVVPPHGEALAQAEDAALRAGQPFLAEVPFQHPDGDVRWIRLASAPRPAADGTTVWEGAEVDVTARRLAEEALRTANASLRASEARARLALDIASVGAFEWDFAAGVGTVDARARAILGLPEDLPAADVPVRLNAALHGEDAPRVRAAFAAAVATAQDGEEWHVEHRVVHDGGAVRHVVSRGRFVFDGAEPRPARLVGALLDVTAEREAAEALRTLNEALEARVAERTAELEAANVQLEVRNRELQDFAHVASHDLQEPLRKIRSFASLLATDEAGTLTDDGRHYVERTQAAAERMSGLIRDLLAFSRTATRQNPSERVDLDAVLAAVLTDLEVSIEQTGGRVEVETLGSLHGDPMQIRQLLQNLVGNALKYHRPGTPPTVRVRTERSAAQVRLVVEDDGIGFDPKHAERIFAPFQRLHGKHAYEGTGMGLAIVRRIAERHGGTVEATSTPGQGSRFVVALPAAAL